MTTAYQKQHAAEMKRLLSALPKQANANQKRFTELCFEKKLLSDLESLEEKQAAAITASMYRHMELPRTSEYSIRVFTPTEEEHGFSAPVTVVELLNDDQPFLLDSLTAELTRHGLVIKQLLHPIIPVTRNDKGELLSIGGKDDAFLESYIHFQVSPLPDGLSQDQLKADLEWVLSHIMSAVRDWQPMVAKAQSVVATLEKAHKPFDEQQVKEARDFIAWLVERNFVFLGYGEYNPSSEGDAYSIVADSRLGILRLIDEPCPTGLEFVTEEHRQRFSTLQLIEITKSNRRSPVHRYVPMDMVIVKRFDEKGRITGESCFVGLFTSNLYYQSVTTIPLLRSKIANVLKRSGFAPVSHDGKSLSVILEFLPRDEILQTSEDALFDMSMGIFALEAKPGVRVFVRKDAAERFASAMVFVPRERFSTDLRMEIQHLLERAYNATSTSFTTQILDTPLARLHLILKTAPGDVPQVDVSVLESDIAKLAYLWSDKLLDALLAMHDESKARLLHRRYGSAFPQAFINRYSAQAAVYDIEKCEASLEGKKLVLELYQDKQNSDSANLKIYNPNQEIALSDVLPLLENAGFRVIEESPFELNPQGIESTVRIRDFKLALPKPDNIMPLKEKLEGVLLDMWSGAVENDRYNALVLKAGIGSREATLLRAYGKYMRQIGFNVSEGNIQQALLNHPGVVRELIALFEKRFAADVPQRDVKQHAHSTAIDKALESVSNAMEDRVLRRMMELMTVTLRTNYYQKSRPILSFKMDSTHVPELPLPRPYAEIFVYSPRVEGIHLRGGKVARGGLRWSDRPDDFRTEVLGLMKAQMVKNSVIVPVGSKGGFVVKRPPITLDREAIQKEGIACYTLYLQGLLDITDNIVAGGVVPPKDVVRHDGDDPYLVVAADKGTASFSDIANSVSAAYDFWLGDAFASGGSVGYDHKEMGITARGGWVSVVRHFKEMGKDIAREDFTCIGIGDMSGDVFGNGMLLSEHTRLVAAFNHMHIFIDPQPDTAASFAERKRLFELPRSSWKDYDAKLISKGGGVFERSAKFITVSEEAKQVLGLVKTSFTPDELIKAILQAPVDLLWNGGIGTYVKAGSESHDQVGDRANNAVRVNGEELRCKVVGEGGNLGFTQLGRIEYARTGGRINTDAIDNSAGVDCSDHEVNIKIAFSRELESGRLAIETRNDVLEAMTDEVAALVLKDNTLQTLALSVSEQNAAVGLESYARLMHALEKKSLLVRAIEYLPDEKSLADLKIVGKGLSRPELAVLLAYSKMDVYAQLSQSQRLTHRYFDDELLRYFPLKMREEFRDAVFNHPLKQEIIATVLTNSLVNRAGITFANDIAEETGASTVDIAVAYALVRDTFGLRVYWEMVDQLTGVVSASVQAEVFARVQQFVAHLVAWLLANQSLPLDIDAVQASLLAPAKRMMAGIPVINDTQLHIWQAKQVPEAMALFLASLDGAAACFDIIRVASETSSDSEVVAALYAALGTRLHLNWLREGASQVMPASFWERKALQGLRMDSYAEQRRYTAAVLNAGLTLEAWQQQHAGKLAQFDGFMESMKIRYTPDMASLSVLLRQIKGIA